MNTHKCKEMPEKTVINTWPNDVVQQFDVVHTDDSRSDLIFDIDVIRDISFCPFCGKKLESEVKLK